MATWQVELIGNESDLQALTNHLSLPKWTITSDGHDYLLTSTELDSLTDPAEVKLQAAKLLRGIDGAARTYLRRVHPFTIGNVRKLHNNGALEKFGAASLLMTMQIVQPDEDTQSAIASFGRAMDVAQHDEASEHALQLLSGNPTLADLYGVYEIVADNVGGLEEITRRGWAGRKDLDRFKMTANNPAAGGEGARHPVPGKRAIKMSPMLLSEADLLIRTLVERWLQSSEQT